jgi:hypothetical protein
VCAGVDPKIGLVASNIGQFNSCTIVNGSLLISDSSIVRWAFNGIYHTVHRPLSPLQWYQFGDIVHYPGNPRISSHWSSHHIDLFSLPEEFEEDRLSRDCS